MIENRPNGVKYFGPLVGRPVWVHKGKSVLGNRKGPSVHSSPATEPLPRPGRARDLDGEVQLMKTQCKGMMTDIGGGCMVDPCPCQAMGGRPASPLKMPPDEPAASEKPGSRDSKPNLWLFKQEPDSYSYDRLVAEGQTLWDGVDNPLARKHLREVKPGDLAYFYHTGKEKAVVGLMEILSGPLPVPGSEDEKAVAVKVGPRFKLPQPVTLAQIKADPAFAEFELVRMSRLSVMPVPLALAKRIDALAQLKPNGPAARSKGR